MRAPRRHRALLGAVAAVPTALAVAPPAGSAATTAPPPDRQEPSTFCSTMMLTPEQLDAGATSTVRCYSTLEESLRAIGVDISPTMRTTSVDDVMSNGDPVIAVHYESFEPGQVPLAVGGNVCNGGGVSFPAGTYWNDRIRATATRGCSTVKHFTEPDYAGQAETVSNGLGVLSPTLAGRVSSMRYW